MEQKFKMQIQRLAKQAAAVLTAVTVGILSAAAAFSQNSNPVYAAENGIYLANANPSYRNPSTGAIEDSGGEGSAVLGQSMTESATYQVLSEIDSITESLTPNEDIDEGKFILINDGEKVKVARGVNSLHILSGDKTEDMKKIKIIEGMDLMRDDIRSAFENNYIGINNSYDNKVMFVAAINQYFDGLVREGVLYGDAENTADIDVNAQRDWLAQKYDISEYSDEQIRKAKTGSYVFVTADITFCDAIEDLKFSINIE